MPDLSFWRGRKVFLTGHTGFMGGWLSTLLLRHDAEVTGYALAPPTTPSFFEATSLGGRLAASVIGDVRDQQSLAAALAVSEANVVFHLAAQPLVRYAHADPHLTFETNFMGTVNLLQAVRHLTHVKAVVVVTTDKVYLNTGQEHLYREDDRLGGREPYSASKAASEFVLDAYRHAFFNSLGAADDSVGLASVRAGNILGGGDWADDRLVPDAVRCFTDGSPLVLRNPLFTRPWQHVLDPLPGYLALAERLFRAPETYSSAWNFGPAEDDCRQVAEVAALLSDAWGAGARVTTSGDTGVFEERLLALDSRKAMECLDWRPKWPLELAVLKAASWYKSYYAGQDVWALSQTQCEEILKAEN